jgi:methylmalonyl-CoA/ethylmalonyl-CoA epimerase
MATKLRHIALAVSDPEASAKFYKDVFGMEQVGVTESPVSRGIYMSDGTICLALLVYYTDEAAGSRGKGVPHINHIGFWVDDLDDSSRTIEEHGGKFFLDLPEEKDSLFFERKFTDPDGLIFDITENGWVGARKLDD